MMARTSLFVDTSGWASYIDRHDPFYRRARSIYQRSIAQRRNLVTTNYVIAELLALLSSRTDLPRSQIIEYIRTIRSAPAIQIVHVDPVMDSATWQMAEQYLDKQWSWVDMSSFVIMQQQGITDALTSDQHFIQAGFRRLLQ